MDATPRPTGTPLDSYEQHTEESVRTVETARSFTAARKTRATAGRGDGNVNDARLAELAAIVCPVLGGGSINRVAQRLRTLEAIESDLRAVALLVRTCRSSAAAGQVPDSGPVRDAERALARLGWYATERLDPPAWTARSAGHAVMTLAAYQAELDDTLDHAATLTRKFPTVRRELRRMLLPLAVPGLTVDDSEPTHVYVSPMDTLPLPVCWEYQTTGKMTLFVARPWEAAAVLHARDLGVVPDGHSDQDVSDTMWRVMHASGMVLGARGEADAGHVAQVTLALLSD